MFKRYVVDHLPGVTLYKPRLLIDHFINLSICLSAYFCLAIFLASLGLTLLFRRILFDFVVYIILRRVSDPQRSV